MRCTGWQHITIHSFIRETWVVAAQPRRESSVLQHLKGALFDYDCQGRLSTVNSLTSFMIRSMVIKGKRNRYDLSQWHISREWLSGFWVYGNISLIYKHLPKQTHFYSWAIQFGEHNVLLWSYIFIFKKKKKHLMLRQSQIPAVISHHDFLSVMSSNLWFLRFGFRDHFNGCGCWVGSLHVLSSAGVRSLVHVSNFIHEEHRLRLLLSSSSADRNNALLCVRRSPNLGQA